MQVFGSVMGSRDNDSDEFRAWARERIRALTRFGMVLTGDARSAEDLVQRALSHAWVAWSGFRRHDDPELYVRRVMLNVRTNTWLRAARDLPEPSSALPDGADPLAIALQELPARSRAIVCSLYCEDRGDLDTARLVGCSLGTVKSQAAKALAKLRGSLPELRDAFEHTPIVITDPEVLVTRAIGDGHVRRRDERRRRAVAFVVVCILAFVGMTGMSGVRRNFRGAPGPAVTNTNLGFGTHLRQP